MEKGLWKNNEPKEAPEAYLMWGEDDLAIGHERRARGPEHIPAPKLKPPPHHMSYNPPAEYLLSESEKERLAQVKADSNGKINPFIPQKYDALRKVPAFKNFIRERFDRCLDLYLCPRAKSKRPPIDPRSLLPKLPDPSELRPFPTVRAIRYRGHTGRVRAISCSPSGEYLVSGSDDGTVRMWEVETGRELASWDVNGVVQSVQWNPNPALHIVAVAVDTRLILINPGTVGPDDQQATFDALSGAGQEDGPTLSASNPVDGEDSDGSDEEGGSGDEEEGKAGEGSDSDSGAEVNPKPRSKRLRVEWQTINVTTPVELEGSGSIAVEVKHEYTVKRICWHKRGDYIATVCPSASNYAAVTIHQVRHQDSRVGTQELHDPCANSIALQYSCTRMYLATPYVGRTVLEFSPNSHHALFPVLVCSAMGCANPPCVFYCLLTCS